MQSPGQSKFVSVRNHLQPPGAAWVETVCWSCVGCSSRGVCPKAICIQHKEQFLLALCTSQGAREVCLASAHFLLAAASSVHLFQGPGGHLGQAHQGIHLLISTTF